MNANTIKVGDMVLYVLDQIDVDNISAYQRNAPNFKDLEAERAKAAKDAKDRSDAYIKANPPILLGGLTQAQIAAQDKEVADAKFSLDAVKQSQTSLLVPSKSDEKELEDAQKRLDAALQVQNGWKAKVSAENKGLTPMEIAAKGRAQARAEIDYEARVDAIAAADAGALANARFDGAGFPRANFSGAGVSLPMVVTFVHTDEFGPGLHGINGQVFLDGNNSYWTTNIRYSVTPDPHTYHFIDS